MENEDRQLIRDHLAGDGKAFTCLVNKYLKPIYNFLCRITNDPATAEDLAQETFFKAYKNIKRYDKARKFKTWLFTIAKNSAFDYLKKKKALNFKDLENDDGESFIYDMAEDRLLPDELLKRKELAEELDQKLTEIPELYRTVLLLHYKEDFSLAEISEVLNEPYNSVKSRDRRGLILLKRLLTESSSNAPE